MISRERIKTILDHKESDRIPIQDYVWESTIERWMKEGLEDDIDLDDYFQYEMAYFLPDLSLQYSYKILEENDEYIFERNNYGEVVRNHKNRSTTPQVIDSPIKNRKDWNEVKSRIKINDTRGLSTKSIVDFSEKISFEEGLKIFQKHYEKGRFIMFEALVGFDLVQRYVGTERLLIALIDEPDWVKEMFLENAKFVIEMYGYLVEKGYIFDGIFLCDDLGYRNTSLISPKHYKELIFEADKFICDFFHSINIKIFLHSCGCVKELIPLFIEAGIDCLQPLEVKAGMDLIDLKRKYGEKMAFMGGIDTRLYSNSNTSLIEKEIETKIEVAKKGGGYIYHCDHSIPHDVSLSQYIRVLGLANKYGKY